MKLDQTFSNPPSAYRGKPFWAWNGRLEEEELRRQIRVFKKMGLGGAFMHSRVGLATKYLSKEWFDLVRACVDESSRNGMEAWLYDEDRWPSGAAGGYVTKDPRYRQRVLRLSIVDPEGYVADGKELGIFIGKVEGSCAYGLRLVDPRDISKAKGGEKALVFKVVMADPSPWYNNQTYLDTLSPEAVRRFIDVTHKAYRDAIGDYFGTVVPGIFTDEPNYGGYDVEQDGAHAPWTDAMPSVFKERYGYDILPHLPSIFFRIDGQDFSKIRYHYRDCLTYLFTHSFSEKIGRWCEKNNLLFTGHVLAEENLLSQTSVVGSAMRFYEFMQAPGIDILRGEMLTRDGGFPPEFATAKQCSSVQHQFGRRLMLSELYGCTGWQFNFMEHKAVGDWQAALGVNLRCQHLAFYTMLGQAKRDYPASISFQSPWWRDYGFVEDYFARVGVMMTQGQPVRDIAVIHPIESAWGLFCGKFEDCSALWDLNTSFEQVQNMLLEEHFDFDYVDEEMLSRLGRAEGKELVVAQASYRAVIIPPTATLRSSTLDILSQLTKMDVPVIFIEPIADRVDGELSDKAKELAKRVSSIKLDRRSLVTVLHSLKGIRRVSIRTPDGSEFPDSLYMLRWDVDSGRYLSFICHTKQDAATGPLTIEMPGVGQVQEWDPVTGDILLAEAEQVDGGVAINTHMHGAGSRIFVVDPNPRDDFEHRPHMKEVRRGIVPPDEWEILRDEPNSFPLDVAEYSMDGGPWEGPMEVLKIDAVVRDTAGLPHRGGRMVQPWVGEAPPDTKTIDLALRFRFHVEKIPVGPCHLVIEEPEKYAITLNGMELEPDQDEGWWIDTSFKRIRVPAWYLMHGENEVLLKTRYGSDSGIEALYLTGEFGMRWDMEHAVVGELPRKLTPGDWTEQGFPCYTGAITYVMEIAPSAKENERVFLEISRWEGVVVKVRVNGKAVGRIAWPPHEVDITTTLKEGTNRLEIEIVGSRRNLLGPLHLAQKYPVWTGSGQFVTTGSEWTNEYVKLPYGLIEPPVLSYRKPEA